MDLIFRSHRQNLKQIMEQYLHYMQIFRSRNYIILPENKKVIGQTIYAETI